MKLFVYIIFWIFYDLVEWFMYFYTRVCAPHFIMVICYILPL